MTAAYGDMVDLLSPGIRKAIIDAVNNELEILEKEATDRLSRRIGEISAGLALRVSELISFEDTGRELLIHVKLDKGK